MKLDQKQWHVQLYFWSLSAWDAFRETHTKRDRSNLCQYIRTIFVWMPLTFISQIAFVAFTTYVMLYYPLTRFGFGGTAKGYVAAMLGIGAIVLFSYLKERYVEYQKERSRVAQVDAVSSDESDQEEKSPGFIEVIWIYLVAAKQKICPMIEFGSDNRKETN